VVDKKEKTVSSGPSAIWVNKPEPGQLPEGVTHQTFYSEVQKEDVGYCIYLPPGYDPEAAKRYPVIYNLHGAGDNELHGFIEMEVLDAGIREGRWPGMIVVLANGGMRTFFKNSYDGKFQSETLIIQDLIPHIDKTYATIAERKGRCIEGHSMGGRGATRLAMKYPSMFCSLFNLAGNVPRTLAGYDPASPDTYPNNYLGPDKENYADNDAFELLKKNLDDIKDKLRIQIFCGTQDIAHLGTVREFHEALVTAGVDHTYLEIEGAGHGRKPIIERYRDIWFDYHVESLRQAGS
jgi:enterochelin esterase-like enzyme